MKKRMRQRDDYSLRLHLIIQHNSVEREDFNRRLRGADLEKYSLSNLEKKCHLLIHKVQTLYPLELNKNNPLGLIICNLAF